MDLRGGHAMGVSTDLTWRGQYRSRICTAERQNKLRSARGAQDLRDRRGSRRSQICYAPASAQGVDRADLGSSVRRRTRKRLGRADLGSATLPASAHVAWPSRSVLVPCHAGDATYVDQPDGFFFFGLFG
ncbi:Uncharacterized protein Adt_24439 [Abeliophyllum distichum]|uniref:Uncharacterized protein n=1 Tax=Abeliophyllum distichum TaxID=126358 RepID=A0ABD1SDR8_9LAMI